MWICWRNQDHFLYNVEFSEVDFIDVHGGLTFSGFRNNKLWWFGYDCCHSDDKTVFNLAGEERTLDYCISECEKTTLQFLNLENTSFHYYILSKRQKISEFAHNKMICWALNNDNYAKKYLKRLCTNKKTIKK